MRMTLCNTPGECRHASTGYRGEHIVPQAAHLGYPIQHQVRFPSLALVLARIARESSPGKEKMSLLLAMTVGRTSRSRSRKLSAGIGVGECCEANTRSVHLAEEQVTGGIAGKYWRQGDFLTSRACN